MQRLDGQNHKKALIRVFVIIVFGFLIVGFSILVVGKLAKN